MKLAALYREDTGVPALHVAVGDGFAAVDELAAAGGAPDLGGLHDVGELYARGPAAVGRLRELASGAQPRVGQAGARYAPPVLRPGKIVCVGLNYADHIAESRAKPPERIVLFAKFSSCLIAHGEPIIRPPSPRNSITRESWPSSSGGGPRTSPPGTPSATSAATRSSTMSPRGICRAPSRSGSGARRWTRSPRSARSSSTRPPRRPSAR